MYKLYISPHYSGGTELQNFPFMLKEDAHPHVPRLGMLSLKTSGESKGIFSERPWSSSTRVKILTTTACWLHGGSDAKESACNVGGLGSIPGLGRSPGEGNGYSLQYSCLENSMDKGAWQATVHGITKSWTRLSNFHFTTAYRCLVQ